MNHKLDFDKKYSLKDFMSTLKLKVTAEWEIDDHGTSKLYQFPDLNWDGSHLTLISYIATLVTEHKIAQDIDPQGNNGSVG
jgi:hypothetical protein